MAITNFPLLNKDPAELSTITIYLDFLRSGHLLPILIITVTYENVENHFSQNCRKWKMTPYSKMPKVEYNLSQKCRKLIFYSLLLIFYKIFMANHKQPLAWWTDISPKRAFGQTVENRFRSKCRNFSSKLAVLYKMPNFTL